MMILGPLLLILVLLGAPLFAVIAAAAFWNFYQADIDLQAIAIEFYGIAEMPILLAIPLFTFAGYLLSESNAPKRLVRLTSALLGWMPAGLAVVSLVACAHIDACAPNFFIQECNVADSSATRDLFAGMPAIQGGYMELPRGPGLGIELNEAAVKDYPYRPFDRQIIINPDGSVGLT